MSTRINPSQINEIFNIYHRIKKRILSQISDFHKTWKNGREEELFAELVFCLLTPGSRARSAWEAVENLKKGNLLLHGDVTEVSHWLNIVRFKNNKARYIINARRLFYNDGRITIREKIKNHKTNQGRREWLVKNVMGMGFKEASHFLRNTGFFEGIAILDRHILKNLYLLGLIEGIPAGLSKKRYLSYENTLLDFSKSIGVPHEHLDFILWYRETGDIFK